MTSDQARKVTAICALLKLAGVQIGGIVIPDPDGSAVRVYDADGREHSPDEYTAAN